MCDPVNRSMPGLPANTIYRSSLRLTSIQSVMPSSHLILGRPLLLLPPIPPSIRVFAIESTLHMRWPKYWSLSFSIIPSKEIPGLISFRMDWLDLLVYFTCNHFKMSNSYIFFRCVHPCNYYCNRVVEHFKFLIPLYGEFS